MRNIAQYPITVDEVKRHLQSYADHETNSGAVGGTGPFICKLVIDWIDDDPENFASFLRAKQALELENRSKSAK
jgi:hypothetical protein